jgi:hypothetical protein
MLSSGLHSYLITSAIPHCAASYATRIYAQEKASHETYSQPLYRTFIAEAFGASSVKISNLACDISE